ncbi:GATA zinc finger domain-containing protein 14-like [Aricia agestis]|uniref:GATA zinc finger domain-containing protein 14-like n=1 Tax=Aricia agestis TaxID=91739 RepID=UPI001C20998E|nr:GATA zinc finger domain-containing protein 14-like [Aricia agestis]
MFFVVSICVILDIAVASPVSNVENVRMASPSLVRSEDVPTSQFYKDHIIFNVPIPELIVKTPSFYPPQISNQPMNQAVNQNPIDNLIEKETKYLKNPHQNSSVLSSQKLSSEIYQNGGRNIQTPIQKLQQLYQESSTLQKLLSNLNLIRNILAPKPQKKQFILVYPNGTIGYEDDLSTVSNKYPNHIILKSSELRTLSNAEDEIQNESDHQQPQENVKNIVSSSTTQSNINDIIDTNQSNSKSIVVNNSTESKNNIEETNTEVIDTTINKTQYYNSVIIPQNTLNDSASKISQLENSENLANNTNNVATTIHNISDSNQNVGGKDTLNITKDINTIITLAEDSENISNAYNVQNLQNTTINKIDEVADKDTTNENQISINSDTKPLNNITSENSYSSKDVTNSSNATNNRLDDGKTATTVPPKYNITHDSNDAIGNIGSNNHNSSLVINNTNTQEDLTIYTHSEDIENVKHNNDSLGGNVTSDCQCYEEQIENDEDGNVELGAPDSVSWVQLAKESAQNILFGEDNPNVFFIFFNPPEMDVERETRTTTYPNGTVVEEFIEIRKVDGTTIRTSTTKTFNNSSTIPLTTNR